MLRAITDAWDKITSFEHLLEAYRKAQKGKRYRREFLTFSQNLDENLHIIQDQLRAGTFQFGPYRRHTVFVPKKRVVMALPVASRVVQWSIYLILNPYFDKRMIETSYACRVGKGSLEAVTKVQYWMRLVESKREEYTIVKIDVAKYFYRVDHQTLKDILGTYIKDEKLMELLCLVIDSNGEAFGLPQGADPDDLGPDEWLNDVGMPIGNLTSQLFANIYLNELDHYCKHVMKIHMYTRYMDDILAIVPKAEARAVYDGIRAYLKDVLKLDINRKSYMRNPDRIEFVGRVITTRSVRLRKKTTMRIKRSWRIICERYFRGEFDRDAFSRRVDCYRGLIEHCETGNLRNRLNEIYLQEREKAHERNPDCGDPLRAPGGDGLPDSQAAPGDRSDGGQGPV